MSPGLQLAILRAAGAAGALARYAAIALFGRRERFPLVILVVNSLGSLAAGALLGLATVVPEPWYLVATTGFCAAFTTFSTFIIDSMRLVIGRRPWAALGNLAASLALGLGCAALGAAAALTIIG
jgi:CrcB protein